MVELSSKTKRNKKSLSSSQSASSSLDTSDEDKASQRRHKSSRRRHKDREDRHRSSKGSWRREEEKKRERKKRDKKDRERTRRTSSRRSRKEGKNIISDSESDDECVPSGPETESLHDDPEDVARHLLKVFPGVSADLEQLLQMVDNGQAVDISGLSERSLVKHLRKLFLSLNLKENSGLVFLLPSNLPHTLEVIGPIIRPNVEPQKEQLDHFVSQNDKHTVPDAEFGEVTGSGKPSVLSPEVAASAPRRRMIGPEMPSAELLAAAAKLTEAEAELREAEMTGDDEVFIGPPPPAMVTEAESANEAERFEEVTRIMGAEVDSPYDVLGVNRNMSEDNMKKRYWKLSLMVHPDKCPHPQANQAFIKMNKAYKDLRDPYKRKIMDEKIIRKEEEEKFKVELKEMREAAHWRRLQGISMEGDDVLLADMDAKVEAKRDEWMTTLPPERKPGMTTQSTKFSRSSKEGRGDTSAWTDTPSERAQKAKMNYLEAYNEAAALASNDQQKKRANSDAELVDKYNNVKRSKSLVEKHQEGVRNRSKKKSKQERTNEEWEGQHPWKPWDREKDLTAGRQKVKLDAENMSQGLSSRFSSGSFQRNFL
ncbi:hypothetical protein RJ639_031778 [Escallonia herrerae]|uniref:J domain-containing protein n=1 Tax=Escallonia herrerae TaxID=1293975 RepID=A0AA88WZT3_9ASTE|nr:hypothetical protein RJ639_031778 [Escallonia herrerae]